MAKQRLVSLFTLGILVPLSSLFPPSPPPLHHTLHLYHPLHPHSPSVPVPPPPSAPEPPPRPLWPGPVQPLLQEAPGPVVGARGVEGRGGRRGGGPRGEGHALTVEVGQAVRPREGQQAPWGHTSHKLAVPCTII